MLVSGKYARCSGLWEVFQERSILYCKFWEFWGFWITSSTSIEVEVPGHWLLSSGRNREEVVELKHADQNAMWEIIDL